jgi:hypothetical protein
VSVSEEVNVHLVGDLLLPRCRLLSESGRDEERSDEEGKKMARHEQRIERKRGGR